MPFILDSLSDYLESRWGIRDRIVIDISIPLDARIYKRILESPENKETLCHLQVDGKIVSIWRPQDWAINYSKYLEDKKKSEERIAKADREKECEKYLVELIVEKMGENAGRPLAPSLARDIITGKKTSSALMFGAEKEKLCW